MAYVKNPTWKDDPDHSTPITAAKLNNIEDGIATADTGVATETAARISADNALAAARVAGDATVQGNLDAHLADTLDAHDASAVSVVPIGLVNAPDVQGALGQLQGAIVGGGMPATIIDAKGDLIVGMADDTPGKLPKGTDGQVLTVDGSTATGLKYAPAASGLPSVASKNGQWLKVVGGAAVWSPATSAPLTNQNVSGANVDLAYPGGEGSISSLVTIQPGGGSLRSIGAPPNPQGGEIIHLRNVTGVTTLKYIAAGATGPQLVLRGGVDRVMAVEERIILVYSTASPGFWVESGTSVNPPSVPTVPPVVAIASNVDVTAANTDLPWGGGSAGVVYQNIYPTGGGSVRGIGAPTAGAGTELTIRNAATGSVTFLYYNGGATGGKILPRANFDLVIRPGDMVTFVYDGATWVEKSELRSVTQQIPVQLNTPRTSSLGGNAFWSVTGTGGYDIGRWEFVKDVDGEAVGIVQIPKTIIGVPGRIVLHTGSNAATGVTRMEVATALAGPTAVWVPALTVETAQDISVAGGYWPQSATFPLTPALGAGQFLIVRVKHLGTHVNDTLAVNTLLWAVVLECETF